MSVGRLIFVTVKPEDAAAAERVWKQGGGPPSARRGGPRPSSKRCAWTPPSRGVLRSGRRGDRGRKTHA
jgi:hypothetical protein